MDALAAGSTGGQGSNGAPSETSLLDGLMFPRSHSDPHVHGSPRGSNGAGTLAATRRLLHSKTLQERRPQSVRVRAAVQDTSPPPRGAGMDVTTMLNRVTHSLPCQHELHRVQVDTALPVSGAAGAAAAAAEDGTDSSSHGSMGFIDSELVPTLPDAERAPRKQKSRRQRSWVAAASAAEGRSRWGLDTADSARTGDAAAAAAADAGALAPRTSAERRPPVGPSAAAARRVGLTEPSVATDGRASGEQGHDGWSDHARNSIGAQPLAS